MKPRIVERPTPSKGYVLGVEEPVEYVFVRVIGRFHAPVKRTEVKSAGGVAIRPHQERACNGAGVFVMLGLIG